MTSRPTKPNGSFSERSEEHTSELQSQSNLVCRLLLEKKKKETSAYIVAQCQRTAESTDIQPCGVRCLKVVRSGQRRTPPAHAHLSHAPSATYTITECA